MIAHSKEPVSVDMYLPNTQRNAACFIDILWPNASSNLNLNNLTGIELEVILPGRVERALKSMLNGGLMILSTNGYMKTCYWALMPTQGICRNILHKPQGIFRGFHASRASKFTF